MVNVCCGPRYASRRALISTLGAINVNHLKPVIESYILHPDVRVIYKFNYQDSIDKSHTMGILDVFVKTIRTRGPLSCNAHLSTEDMLKSVVTEEKEV